MTVLIDSNIFIKFLKDDYAVVKKIKEYVSKKIPIFISSISFVFFVYL